MDPNDRKWTQKQLKSSKDGLKSRGSNRTLGGNVPGMAYGANESTVGSTAVGIQNTLQQRNPSNRGSSNQAI